jgi:hypothetical protein
MTAWHGLPIGRHVDYLAGWRYLLDAAYRDAVRRRWRDASRYAVAVDRVLGVLSVLFSTLLFGVLVAALVNALT